VDKLSFLLNNEEISEPIVVLKYFDELIESPEIAIVLSEQY